MTEFLKRKLSNSAREITRFPEFIGEFEVNVSLWYEQHKEFEGFEKENLRLTPEHEKIYEMEKRLKDAEL